jgi:hypothetical protein
MTLRKSVEGIKRVQKLKMLEGMEEAHNRNKTKKFCISACGIRVSFCLSTSLCEERVI